MGHQGHSPEPFDAVDGDSAGRRRGFAPAALRSCRRAGPAVLGQGRRPARARPSGPGRRGDRRDHPAAGARGDRRSRGRAAPGRAPPRRGAQERDAFDRQGHQQHRELGRGQRPAVRRGRVHRARHPGDAGRGPGVRDAVLRAGAAARAADRAPRRGDRRLGARGPLGHRDGRRPVHRRGPARRPAPGSHPGRGRGPGRAGPARRRRRRGRHDRRSRRRSRPSAGRCWA